jgi:hypothetical protein
LTQDDKHNAMTAPADDELDRRLRQLIYTRCAEGATPGGLTGEFRRL